MSTLVMHYPQLLERLATLPPPRDGCVRVYRGQAADFGRMVPSALRAGATPWNRLWDLTLKPLEDALSAASATPSADVALDSIAYWFKVLAQHYGPASPFLDVSTSVEVALWFALHDVTKHRADRFGVSQGDVQIPIECPTLSFTRRREGRAWLYVIDAPLWTDGTVLRHGDVVDLSRGPAFVADAPRVRRQHGCLVWADASDAGGDLSSLYACPPIELGAPFPDVPILANEAFYMFPSPADDDWYARLLRAPLIPQPDGDKGYVFVQSLGVYLVTPEATDEHLEPYLDRQVEYLRPLTRLVLRAGERPERLVEIVGAYPDAATYIGLETPWLTASPPVGSLWNQSLLMTGLAPTTAPETVGGDLLPDVSLENVLVEFSALDWAFRESPSDARYAPRQWRAVWLVRRNQTIWMTLFVAGGAGSGIEMEILRVEYDTAARELVFVDAAGARKPATASAASKPLFVALAVVRDLSATVKPDAILSMAAGDVGLVGVRGATARLVRPACDELDLRLHFVRYAHSGERYLGPLPLTDPPPLAVLEVDLTTPFEDLRGLEQVYGRVRRANIDDRTIDWPHDDASGHSPAAAEALSQRFPAGHQEMQT